MFTRSFYKATALLGLVITSVALAQGRGLKLFYNGKVASTDIRIIEGKAYVPLDDFARAQNLSVTRRADGYEVAVAGGATQVEGLRGKIGDVLFDGRWRFQVLDVKEVVSYTMKNKSVNDYSVYSATAEYADDVFHPKSGNTLVVMHCRLKNGLKQNQALWRYNNDTHTALTDDQGQSYPPIAYDMEGTASFSSKELLPGSTLDFAVLFTVPPGTKFKDLVFTLRTLSEKGHEVRVSLTP